MRILISPDAKLPGGVGVKLIAILLLHNLPVLHAGRRKAVQPSRNNEAADCPAPDKYCNRRGDEQRGDEDQECDTDPEQGKDDGGAKGEENS